MHKNKCISNLFSDFFKTSRMLSMQPISAVKHYHKFRSNLDYLIIISIFYYHFKPAGKKTDSPPVLISALYPKCMAGRRKIKTSLCQLLRWLVAVAVCFLSSFRIRNIYQRIYSNDDDDYILTFNFYYYFFTDLQLYFYSFFCLFPYKQE